MNITEIKQLSEKIIDNVSKVIVGKRETIELVVIALICDGHILLEDVPGMGKTLLANTMAKSIGADFRRIQFTPDLLPSDITGINFYNQKEGEFVFRKGPLFSNIVLADEINRATPRTQSSLLESMEEKQITIDGITHILENPYLVIATQNPVEIQGTFPLPEAQLDRFLLKIKMGYPSTQESIEILKRFKKEKPQLNIEPVVTSDEIVKMQNTYSDAEVTDDMYKYIVKICEATRNHPDVLLGVSPRGTQALLKASQVKAILDGRDYVIPDDIKKMSYHVLNHRMILKSISDFGNEIEMVIKKILDTVEVPTEEGLGNVD